MKISLKNKSSTIIASTLVAAFFSLHYYVYLDNASGEVPLLQSYTDAPIEMEELFLREEIKPSYFNPFRKVQFVYSDTKTEETVIEQADSIFTSKMSPLVGDPYKYHEDFNTDGFARPQIGYTYANLLFFTIQYLIITTFAFLLLKP